MTSPETPVGGLPSSTGAPTKASVWANTFDRALDQEMLRTECRRTTTTAGLLLVLLVVVVVLGTVPELVAPSLRDAFRLMTWPLSGLLAVYGVFEVLLRSWMVRRLRDGRGFPTSARYLQVGAEVTLPTLALLVSARILGSHQALGSAIPNAYFLFVFLTALSLDARLSAFAGMFAGVQFAGVSLLLLNQTSDQGALLEVHAPMLVSPHQFVIRGLFLALSGLLAAFVARSTRRQIEVALRTVEERDRAVSIFGQHVSPQVADMLLKQPLPAGGQERNVCVLFLDIRDFSRMAGDSTPSEVMDYLNRLFGFMIPVVNRNQGIINKFLGDGFMAVFGAPADDAEQCRHAIETAFEILSGVERLGQEKVIPATRLGIGIHVGQAVTGNVGSMDRKEYTIIGDVVNLASRIEQATKQFGARLLVSSAVWDKLAPKATYPAEDLGFAELKGQAKPTRLFKLA
jgi:adenylate cyclase